MAATILWRWVSGQGLPRSHWGQRRGREETVYLPWTLLGLGACLCYSKSCPFSPPLPPLYPSPRLPLPSYTKPSFSPTPAIHAIYLISVQSEIKFPKSFCSVGLMSVKLQTPLTEADHDNMLCSSSHFFHAFCQRSGLNWHWLVVGRVQKHQALSEHPLELSAHVKTSSLGNLCDCTE